MEKEGFIYIWYDRKHKRFYIGCHWGNIDDGYICSSSWMKKSYKYRPNDFKRRILKRGIPRRDLLTEEHKYLDMIKEEELGKRYYNLHRHHFGHWSNTVDGKTTREKLSEASKKLHADPEYKKKYMEGRKKMPPQTQEQIAKRAASNTGKKRTEETKKKMSDALKGRVNGPLSEETKKKLSVALSGENNPFYGKTHSKEAMAIISSKISATMKGRTPKNIEQFTCKGMKWWNNGMTSKRSMECPGSDWNLGRKRSI